MAPLFCRLVESVALGRLAGGTGITDRFPRRAPERVREYLLAAAGRIFRERDVGVSPPDIEPEFFGVAIFPWIEENGLNDINEGMSDERLRDLANWLSNLVLVTPWLN